MKEKKMSLWKIYIWCMSFIFRKYFIYVFLFIVLVFVQQFCLLLIPKYIQQFIDNVVLQNIAGNLRILYYLLGTIVIMIIVRPLYMLCKMHFCEKGTCDIQYSVVDKARTLGYDYFENTPRGQMLAETYQNVLSIYFVYENYFPNMMIALFSFVIATIRIFLAVSPMLNILLFVCYAIIVLTIIVSNKELHSRGKEETEKKNEFYRHIYDMVESKGEIQASRAQPWFLSRLYNALRNMFEGQKKLFIAKKKLAVLLAILQAIAITSFLFFAKNILGNSANNIGEVVAVFLYLTMSMTALKNFVNQVIDQSGSLAGAEKPYRFFRLSPSVVEKKDAIDKQIEGEIVFKDVSFIYGENKVLDRLNLTIKKGEHVVIVGESGSGKTTILKLLLRYYQIKTGNILLDGLSIDNYKLSCLREYIGIVFQESFLFTGNVLDNLEFANPYATDTQLKKVVELVCLDKLFATKKALVEKKLSSRGENLSGGERQRLSIARLYLKNPNIVLLDEVTSDLDYITEDKVLRNLFSYYSDKTMIMVSHKFSVIQKFQRILVINNGRIVQDGSFDEVSKDNTCFSSLVDKGSIKNL